MAQLPPINFKALADALLAMSDRLVPQWLPGGSRRGLEWVCGDLSGSEGSSCSINLKTGAWADFAGDARGNDLISLYAAIHDLGAGEAAIELARAHGLEDVANIQKRSDTPVVVRTPLLPPPKAVDKGPQEAWATSLPVPEFAHELASFKHYARKPEDITHTAAYWADGHLLGYVVRFRTSDGGKDTLPYTWCVSEGNGTVAWRWRQWDEPRPLFYPGKRSPVAVKGDKPFLPTVVVVEGERKAEVLQKLLDEGAPDVYVVVSWPGGSKAWKKACWDWLMACSVLLWPDCDAKREPLTKAEREQYSDPAARALAESVKPLLPLEKQPGMSAMLGIGALLRDTHGCNVQLLPIPAPGDKPDGWDAADAIETDGWDLAKVLEFFGRAGPLPVQTPAPGAAEPAKPAGQGGGGKKPPASGESSGAGVGGDDEDDFKGHLEFICEQMGCKVHHLKVNRKLVIAALRKSSLLRECVGFNEMTCGPATRQPWPWRQKAGPLENSDALRLGDFLSRHYKLPGASKAALEEAMDTVADECRFHPIRDWLDGLQHDGKKRLDGWLIHVLGHKPDDLPPNLAKYLALVGRYVLMGLVARVMQPGCKFDYSLVLEGPPGLGKSTLIKALVGEEYFSDTHFDIGAGKDGFEQFEGLWGYELSEMTALRRADSEQVKQFFSSQVDRYRGAYQRFVQPHPRQVVIFCSTNKRQYLYDLTGNRRFWPVRCGPGKLKVDWVRKYRDQLFAEALAAYRAGETFHPDEAVEKELFEPQQKKRLVETAVQARLYQLLTREGTEPTEGKSTNWLDQNTKFVTLDGLVVALGADAAKSTAQLEQQIKGWLEAMGWEPGREGGGQRRRGYKRPPVWPPEIEAGEEDEAVPDGPAQQKDGEPGEGEPSTEGADGAPF